MTVTPTGIISLPLHYLRQSIAASTTFQTWVGADDAEEALDNIYSVATIVFTRPFAVVDWAKNFKRTKNAGGTRNHFEQSGELAMLFRGSIDPTHNDSDAAFAFLNTVGAIISEIEELAGVADYLDIVSITLDQGPHRPGEDEAKTSGAFYEVVYRVEFAGK